MSRIWQDLRFGLRLLGRRPGFTFVTLTSLALGIGISTAIYSILDALYFRPLPIKNLHRIAGIRVALQDPTTGEYSRETPFNHALYRHLKENAQTFSDLGVYTFEGINITNGEIPEQVTGHFVSAGYFEALGLNPAVGRFFLSEEEEDGFGSHPVAVISHRYWSRRFGSDPGVVGQLLKANGTDLQIVGVAPAKFSGIEISSTADFFMPVTMYPQISQWRAYFSPQLNVFFGFGHLAPGATLVEAREETAALIQDWTVANMPPSDHGLATGKVVPLLEVAYPLQFRASFFQYRKILIATTGILLLTACLNVASLLLIRGLERHREIAIRRANGAGPGRIRNQLLGEGLLLFLLGGLLSIPVSMITLRLLWRFRPNEMESDVLDLGLQPIMLAFALGIALLTGLVFNLLPALKMSRDDINPYLKSVGLSGNGSVWLKPGNLLVIAQVALTLTALIGAGLFLNSLANARQLDLGFEPKPLLAVTLAPGNQGFEQERYLQLYREIEEAVNGLPGVAAAAFSENRLLEGAPLQSVIYIAGASEPLQIGTRVTHRTNAIHPGFFETTGLTLLEGRDFRSTDRQGTEAVAIVNQTMAERAWPDGDGLEKTFLFNNPTTEEGGIPIRVVGVVEDARYREILEETQGFIYVPIGQRPPGKATLHVQAEADPAALVPLVRRAIHDIEPTLVLSELQTMGTFVNEALWSERTAATLLTAYGILAMVLAVIGIYGLVSYSVRQRHREYGIRMAMGASQGKVLGSVLTEALKVTLIGVVLGCLLARFVLGPMIRSQLHEIGAGDPKTYFLVALVVLVAAMLGCLLPARQASRVDPMHTLRAD